MKKRLPSKNQEKFNPEGFITEQDELLLYTLAKSYSGDGDIVEIGSWKGASTIALARGVIDSKKDKTVFAVDHFKGSEEHKEEGKEINTFDDFKLNVGMAGVQDFVKPIKKDSKSASKQFKGKASMLFIDGDHSYEGVLSDLKSWFPKLIKGGLIAFHDNNWEGVRRVIEEYIENNPVFESVKKIGIITYATKKGDKLVRLPTIE